MDEEGLADEEVSLSHGDVQAKSMFWNWPAGSIEMTDNHPRISPIVMMLNMTCFEIDWD